MGRRLGRFPVTQPYGFQIPPAGGLGITTDDVENVSDVDGTTATEALDNLLSYSPQYVFTYEDQELDNGRLQAALDAMPDNSELFVNSAGEYILQKPIRLLPTKTIRGLGERTTIFKKGLGWYAGPSILYGAIQGPQPHGPPILDDADFSYNFVTGPGVYYWQPIGLYGCNPRNLNQLWFEFSFVVNSVPGEGTFFTILGETETVGVTGMSLDVSWKFTLDVLLITFFTDTGGIQLETTTTFNGGDIGTRHILAIGWDGVTLKLFVDGVLEASGARGGTFNPPPWQVAVIGGRWIQFGRGTWQSSALFDLGHLLIADVNRQTGNYIVSWNTPDATDAHFLLTCLDANEDEDLIKVVAEQSGYSYTIPHRSQTLNAAGGEMGVDSIGFATSGTAGGTSIEIFECIRSHARNIQSVETGIQCWGNCYFSEFEDIVCMGERFGMLFSGGLLILNGTMLPHGNQIGAVLLGGGGAFEQFFTYDYSSVGVWMDTWGGVIECMGISDESTPPGVDPLYGIVYRGAEGLASAVVINNLDINVINSDTTIPICLVVCRLNNLIINGSSPIMEGLTTPPAHYIKFTNPTLTDPIQVNMWMEEAIPIANHPQKVLTPAGPAGGTTLTSAFLTTVTARQAREWDYDGVTLLGDSVLRLSNELDTGIPVLDGTIIQLKVNPTFAGFTLNVQNYDTVSIRIYTVAGWAQLRWSATNDTWEEVIPGNIELPDDYITPEKMDPIDFTVSGAYGTPGIGLAYFVAGVNDATFQLPFKWRLLNCFCQSTTAGAGGSTGQWRTAAGGGGVVVTSAMSTASTGVAGANVGGGAFNPNQIIAANTNIFFLKSDNAAAGVNIITYIRID